MYCSFFFIFFKLCFSLFFKNNAVQNPSTSGIQRACSLGQPVVPSSDTVESSCTPPLLPLMVCTPYYFLWWFLRPIFFSILVYFDKGNLSEQYKSINIVFVRVLFIFIFINLIYVLSFLITSGVCLDRKRHNRMQVNANRIIHLIFLMIQIWNRTIWYAIDAVLCKKIGFNIVF